MCHSMNFDPLSTENTFPAALIPIITAVRTRHCFISALHAAAVTLAAACTKREEHTHLLPLSPKMLISSDSINCWDNVLPLRQRPEVPDFPFSLLLFLLNWNHQPTTKNKKILCLQNIQFNCNCNETLSWFFFWRLTEEIHHQWLILIVLFIS